MMFPVAKFKLCVFLKGCKFFILIGLPILVMSEEGAADRSRGAKRGPQDEHTHTHPVDNRILIFGHAIKFQKSIANSWRFHLRNVAPTST